MSWTLSTSGAATYKAGSGVSSTLLSNASALNKFSDQAEGELCAETDYDWVANYASVGANFLPILDSVVSSKVAKNMINYDMSGYTSRAEAGVMLNVIDDDIQRNVKTLKDAAVRKKMGAG